MTIFSLRQLPETGIKTRLKAGIKSALLAGMMVAGTIAPAAATDKITLLLDWFVNPDHGPIIIAEEKGYFKDAPQAAPSWRFPISRNCICKLPRACRWCVSAHW